MKNVVLFLLSIVLCSCNTKAQSKKGTDLFPITKSDAEWKEKLSPQEYYILREKGTERPFSSEFNKNHNKGTYICAACDTPLFKSEYKFDSGSGWPSFDREIKANVEFSTDNDLLYTRTEEHCASCGGHLGHVFNDGPANTTGLRHCINGAALKFIPKKTMDEK